MQVILVYIRVFKVEVIVLQNNTDCPYFIKTQQGRWFAGNFRLDGDLVNSTVHGGKLGHYTLKMNDSTIIELEEGL